MSLFVHLLLPLGSILFFSPGRAVKGRRHDCSLGLEEKREEKGTRHERESIVTISPSNNRTVCLPFGQTLSGSWKTLDGWRRTTTTSAASSEPLVGWYIIPAAKWVAGGGTAVLSRGWRNNTNSFLAFLLESFKVRSALSAPPRPNQLLTQYEIALLTGRERDSV